MCSFGEICLNFRLGCDGSLFQSANALRERCLISSGRIENASRNLSEVRDFMLPITQEPLSVLRYTLLKPPWQESRAVSSSVRKIAPSDLHRRAPRE